ncbi:MAG: hypothetical protein KF813_05595 [Trueperaceae bacterium]|nr:hypothetical protein [Trueperaceae bacterium]
MAGTAHAADALARPVNASAVASFLVVDGPEALLPLYSWGHSRLFEMVIGGTSVWRKDG